MRYALEARFGSAAVALVVAAFIDGLDGRLARLLKATSRFGAEFDSLTDFCCFGIAPAFILYIWSLHSYGGFGFAPCLIFTVCMALRLGSISMLRLMCHGRYRRRMRIISSLVSPRRPAQGSPCFRCSWGLEGHSLGIGWLERTFRRARDFARSC